ncbi:unnamed protein product, partial [Tetraodon nigroviridis]
FLLCVALLGSVGAILDMDSESWLLKGFLLACVIGGTNVASSATVQVLFMLNATALLYYYLRACGTDPGFVRSTEEEKKKNVLVLAEAGCFNPRVFCTSSLIKKPMRTQHCYVCDACVAKQDHHSIWINGCIGTRTSGRGSVSPWAAANGADWVTHCPLRYAEQGLWGAASALVDCSPWLLCVFFLAFYHTCWSSSILLVQLYQIAVLGLTSAERTTLVLQQRRLQQPVSLRQNPYNLGVLRNLVSFSPVRCCGLFKPAVIDWTQQLPHGPDHLMFAHADTV